MSLPPYSFAFQSQELPQILCQLSKSMMTGYWLFEFSSASSKNQVNPLYLSVSQGRAVFSGNQRFSWQEFLKALQRYVLRLRDSDAGHILISLEQKLASKKQEPLPASFIKLLYELDRLNLVSDREILKAIRLKILSDFDTYLFDFAGQAQFSPSPPIAHSPMLWFDLEELVAESSRRRAGWAQLELQIPSMESIPILHPEAISPSFSVEQKICLETLMLGGKSLNEIAQILAKDSLEIAQGFSHLIKSGLVTFDNQDSKIPQTAIVDDSPFILKQFQSLVTEWGYGVNISQDPKMALQMLLRTNPAVIFLDINMPEVSGFDLVKQIRREPKLAETPLIMLTAEKTLSNSWRAQWSGCRFLTKPLSLSEVAGFQIELHSLLDELAPLHLSTAVEDHRMNYDSPPKMEEVRQSARMF